MPMYVIVPGFWNLDTINLEFSIGVYGILHKLKQYMLCYYLT